MIMFLPFLHNKWLLLHDYHGMILISLLPTENRWVNLFKNTHIHNNGIFHLILD